MQALLTSRIFYNIPTILYFSPPIEITSVSILPFEKYYENLSHISRARYLILGTIALTNVE